MQTVQDKSRVNLYISKSLSDDAKRLGINMSQTLERTLRADIAKKWEEANKTKIERYNDHIASSGLPFDDDDLAVQFAMNQFDVFVNPIAKGRALYPFVCCLQSELLYRLSTRVVCFVTNDQTVAFDKVSVPICINNVGYYLCMNVVATIEGNRLNQYVCNVSEARNNIVNSYDALLMGI